MLSRGGMGNPDPYPDTDRVQLFEATLHGRIQSLPRLIQLRRGSALVRSLLTRTFSRL